MNSKSKPTDQRIETETPPRAFRSRPTTEERIEFRGASLAKVKAANFLAVEIGCGVGLHPIQYTKNHPDHALVAIERTSEKFARFASRLENHVDLHDRLCAVHADAIHFLDRNFSSRSIDEAWILYPNPEMKKPSRRWFQTPFMGRLAELLKPGASLFFATNIASYADESVSFVKRHGFQCVDSNRVSRATHPDWKPRTHFEKKYLDRGETIFDFKFRLEPSGASRP